jgi:malonyl-CoA/methylmalonyl-CoA synthetase
VRLFIAGSSPLRAETHRAWQARTGHAILERYGMTETGMIASNPCDGERLAGTVRFPLPGVTLRIADPETGAEFPRGEAGAIELRGPNVFRGYWRKPRETAEAFRADARDICGDVGPIDDCGYLHILGRAKDFIITGGFNVYPKEIETEIDSLEGVRESAVIGVPHPDFGEAVVAVVVLEPGATLDDAVAIQQLGGSIARYKLPKRIFVVSELPRNTMGKVQKAILRQALDGTFA